MSILVQTGPKGGTSKEAHKVVYFLTSYFLNYQFSDVTLNDVQQRSRLLNNYYIIPECWGELKKTEVITVTHDLEKIHETNISRFTKILLIYRLFYQVQHL